MGAVGVYSNCTPYNNFIEQNINGILLENDPQRWVDAITLLINKENKRVELANNAKVYAYSLAR